MGDSCEMIRSPLLMWSGDSLYPSEGGVVSVVVHVACYIEPICNHSRAALHTDLKVYEGAVEKMKIQLILSLKALLMMCVNKH